MQLHLLPEIGSFARFFLETVAMFLLVSALAFFLITAAYATPVAAAHLPVTGQAFAPGVIPDA